MIIFEIPSHQIGQINYIHEIADSCIGENIGFAISMNGNTLSSNYNYNGVNIVMKYKELKITDPCVSMVELRANANEVASEFFEPEYRIMADHNFVFKGDWVKYIHEAVKDMERFTKITGRPCYMGMGGTLGAYGHGKKPFLGPQPIFPSGRGIIYTMANVYDYMEKLPSSLEEQYMTSILFVNGHVPLRKMMSPIYHRMVDTGKGIHDKSLIDKYNSALVREIWNDKGWVLKPSFTTKAQLTGGKYYANIPKTALKAMARLKDDIRKIPGTEEFFAIDYGA